MPPQQAQPRSYRVPGERSSDTEKGIRTGNIEVVSSLVKYGAGNPILFGRVALKEGTNTTLTVDEAENAIQINSSGTGGSSKWTDGGTITYLTDTDDDLAIGGTDASSPFFWDYSETQLYVEHAKVGNLDGVVKASSGVLAGSATTDDLPEGATNKYFSNENIDDRVAALIQNGTGLTWTYDDGAGTLTGNVSITQYTDEMAQDAVGGILVDSDEIDFTYTDATPSITASIKADSIDDTMIDWGVGANQVNTDDIPEGSTNKFDETVSLTEGTGIDITGTYPNFTIASTVSPGTTDHAALSHLAYADAGHTGFEPTVTKGNLSEVTSSILTITGGTGAVIGSGVTIAVQQANATLSGYLSTTDWNTFNNKVGTETDPVWTAAESGYFKLAGRSGGQVAIGGTGSGDDLTLQTTSNATKGSYILSDISDGIIKATSGVLSAITDNSSNWDTAYGWGDHASAGYFVKASDDSDDITEGTSHLFDKTVSLTEGDGIDITGTYPDFTIAASVTQYTDEQAQDAVGTILDNGTLGDIEFTYTDATPSISANVESTWFGTHDADDLGNVDETGRAKNLVLKWNGTNWVPAAYDATFTFSIASYSDGETTTQLIGTGVWQADETMSYTATYNNGPPTTADVKMSINGGAYNKVGAMSGPAYTSGTNTDGDINYPAAKDQYLRFRLDAGDGTDSDIEYETAIYFRNYIYWGVASKASGFNEADVESLANSEISNDQTRSMSLNAGSGQYLVFAFPSSYTSIPDGADYETDGDTGFLFNSIACAFSAPETVSITNSAGFTENYKVYASTTANLGNHTLVTTTSAATINYLYYGVTTDTSGYDEADIEGLANSTVTNDNTQTWNSVTAGTGEYLLFAFPKRLGLVSFWVGGFEGGFESPETVSVTNSNGWTEDYYVWRSTNSGLGATVVTTQNPV